MDIQTPKGEKISFLGKNGHEHELIEALAELEIGKEYTITSMDVSRFTSIVTIKENNKSYNSVMFKNKNDDYIKYNWFKIKYGIR
jgi:hypothetical protein